jgi:uncharacterized protein YaeQ
VALTSTMHVFDVELADADRGVYETFALRVARHPSESEEYLVTRLLARCLEHAEGIAFSSGGLSDPDEPPISVRDLTGRLLAWIDVGGPDAARLHRASKAAPRVAVYTSKDVAQLQRAWTGERIHRAEEIEVHAFEPALIAALASRLQRRMSLAITVTGGQLYLTIDGAVVEGAVTRHAIETR